LLEIELDTQIFRCIDGDSSSDELDFEFTIFEDIISEREIEVLYSSVDFRVGSSDIAQVDSMHSEHVFDIEIYDLAVIDAEREIGSVIL